MPETLEVLTEELVDAEILGQQATPLMLARWAGELNRAPQKGRVLAEYAIRHPENIRDGIFWFLLNVYDCLDKQVMTVVLGSDFNEEALMSLGRLTRWGKQDPVTCQMETGRVRLEIAKGMLALASEPKDREELAGKVRDCEAYVAAMKDEQALLRKKERQQEERYQTKRPRKSGW